MNDRHAIYWAFTPMVLAVLVFGCEQKPAPAPPPPPPPVTVTPPPAMVEPEPPPPPPKKTADEIIDEFLATSPYQRTDDMLVGLSELDQGLNRITELDLTRSPVSERGLQVLSVFPRLKTLNLSNCRISNNSLKSLPECKNLEVLVLTETGIDSGGLIYVGQLPKLQELNVVGTAISDAGFVSLKDLKNLEVLQIDNNPNLYGREFGRLVNEGAFSSLRKLSCNNTRLATYGADTIHKLDHLQVFQGQGAGVTDQVLDSLGKCKDLLVLDVANTSVTSVGMKKLAKLDVLEELNLSNCHAVADIAFNYLKANKTLKKLDVNGTACTAAAVQLLADKFLVGTEISFNGNTY